MARVNWNNIPIPEEYLILMGGGVALHRWRPKPLITASRLQHLVGWPALLTGIVLAGWTVAAVRGVQIDPPTRLVDAGPFAHSRNPMYIAWTLVYAAVTILVNTVWLLALLPALLVYTHARNVRGEEKHLEAAFGDEYRAYRRRVRRYI